MKIFPELSGFVIFSPENLKSFIEKNNVGRDVLSFLRDSKDSHKLVDEGVLKPMFNIEDGFYDFSINLNSGLGTMSSGFFISTGQFGIVGIGYLTDFNFEKLIDMGKVIIYELDCGEYEFSYSVFDERINLYFN